MSIEAAPSLRDTLEANYEAIEKAAPVEAPVVEVKAEVQPEAKTEPVDTRARDEQGRFTEKPKDVAQPVAPAPRKRPSSWKPELDPHWEKLPKEVQEEIERRENDFIKGVSTYKQEYDKVKPIEEALKPYQPLMQQHNIKPEQFITALASTHQTLVSGSKEEKLKAFAKFAQDYQIPLHEMLIQGDDGKVYLNQAYFQSQPAQPQTLTREEAEALWAQKFAQVQLKQHIDNFIAAKDQGGNPLYPHYKEVWTTMDGLLRAGLAKDLPDAYAAAIALPKHSSLLSVQRKTEDEAKARATAEAAARAKANAVSPRNQSPTDLVVDKRATQKGLRSILEDAFEQHSGGGRV